ncbi:hypothetical protein [Pleomorphovibrio marinus]|uniref:hypothetical protein n=1 Tax=Pleomorphovibrio marinus TaxID=2164132 RepID=UPI000E0C06CC|nr:hypothetical protein [Pleomorphovibrio marinus]
MGDNDFDFQENIAVDPFETEGIWELNGNKLYITTHLTTELQKMTVIAFSGQALHLQGIRGIKEEIPEVRFGDEVLIEAFTAEQNVEVNFGFKEK